MVDAWQRDDLDAWLSMIHADAEWLSAVERRFGEAGRIVRGHEGLREFWTFWRTEFVDFWMEVDDIRDLGDERVLQLSHAGFRGPASGIMVESELAQVLTFRNGKVVRSLDYLSHREALRAVGLEE